MTIPEPPFDWRTISRDWQAHDPPPALAALQPRLQRETRRLAAATALDIVAFVTTTALIVTVTLARPTTAVIVAAVAVIALGAWITVFSIMNRRGTWRAETATPAGQIALLRRRARATMRATRFARATVLAQTVAVVSYVTASVRAREATVLPMLIAVLLAGAVSAAYLKFASRQETQAKALLEEATELERLLLDDGEPADEVTMDVM